MEETASTSDGCVVKPRGSRQLMEPMMEIGQHPSQPSNCPRSSAHHCHHVRTLDALDHHVETVFAHVFNRRYGESLASDILHDASFLEHRTILPGAPEHKARAIFEDVRVSTRRQQWSGVHHARQGSCRSCDQGRFPDCAQRLAPPEARSLRRPCEHEREPTFLRVEVSPRRCAHRRPRAHSRRWRFSDDADADAAPSPSPGGRPSRSARSHRRATTAPRPAGAAPIGGAR